MLNKRIPAAALAAVITLSSLLCGCSDGFSGTGRDNLATQQPAVSLSVGESESLMPGSTEAPLSDAETEPASAQPSGGSTRISFAAAGDNIIHESVYLDAASRAAAAASTGAYSGKYYFSEMYAGVESIIRSADISYVNQEAPIAGDLLGVSAYPKFNAPEEAGDALVDAGFDIVNIANNHMLDMDSSRTTGYLNTIQYWKSKSVTMIGGYESEADYDTPRIIERDGIRIALLSYTYGTNGYTLSSASPGIVVPYINDADITRQVGIAKAASDIVIVSIHWGTDTAGESFNNYPTAEQKRLAQLLADLGTDVILGMHPHVIQPVNWLTGSQGNRTLCVYSLGNLLSTMLHSYNMIGGILTFDILKSSSGVTVENPVVVPVMCHDTADPSVIDSQGFATRSGVALYLLSDYTEELASRSGTQLYGAFTLSDLRSYVTSTIDPEFLPAYLK